MPSRHPALTRLAAVVVLSAAASACQLKEGIVIVNVTDAHIVVVDLRVRPGPVTQLPPRQAAQLPPHTGTSYNFKGCTGPLEVRTDDGRVVKLLERVCDGDPDLIVNPQDLQSPAP